MVKVVLQITFFLCVCQNLDVVGIKETSPVAAGAFIQKQIRKKRPHVFPPQKGLVIALATSKQNEKWLRVVGRVLRDHQRPDFAIEV